MSHHNSYYASSHDATEDVGSPIAMHHTSVASYSHHSDHHQQQHSYDAASHHRPADNRSTNVSRRSNNASSSAAMARQHEELAAIQAEIEALKERRRQLEVQRQHAASGNGAAASAAGRSSSAYGGSRASSARASARASQNTSMSTAADYNHNDGYGGGATRPHTGGAHTRGMSPSRRYSHDASNTTTGQSPISKRSSSIHADPSRMGGGGSGASMSAMRSTGAMRRSQSAVPLLAPSSRPLDHTTFIPSERDRRERLHMTRSAYRDMKEAMKASWQSDTTLVGGYFLTQDNPKTGTFGRARRFANIQGQKEQYYLGTDVQLMQESARSNSRPHYSVSNRGKSGCNVNSHWNDSKGGAAPGPGAYNPRYQKLAPPSILTRR